MKTVMTGLAVAGIGLALGIAPAAAQCAHSVAKMTLAKPGAQLAQMPMSERQDMEIESASLVDGWLVRYLDKPVS